jgi:hypothetical protein
VIEAAIIRKRTFFGKEDSDVCAPEGFGPEEDYKTN